MISSMAMVASAATTGTITVYDANNEIVEGTYTTIDTAAAAAGVNGRIELSEGTFEFGGRQTIAVEGVDLIGAGRDKTFIVPSASFSSASTTNKKALLAVTANATGENYVAIEGITIDGSVFGDTIDMSALSIAAGNFYDFNVVRINNGVVKFNDVQIEGSQKTLLSIGTAGDAPTTANVTATNFYAQGEEKTITTNNTYADIDVVTGSFTMTSGQANAFITEDSANTFSVSAAGHFVFVDDSGKRVCSTPRHIIDSYNTASSAIAWRTYGKLFGTNDAETVKMVNYLKTNESTMSTEISEMKTIFTALKNNIWLGSTYDSLFDKYIGILDGTVVVG